MKIERFYIRASGSVCYDRTGITFPAPSAIDFVALLKKNGVKNYSWCRENGWSNQPRVLCFRATAKEQVAINHELPMGLFCRLRTWERR